MYVHGRLQNVEEIKRLEKVTSIYWREEGTSKQYPKYKRQFDRTCSKKRVPSSRNS